LADVRLNPSATKKLLAGCSQRIGFRAREAVCEVEQDSASIARITICHFERPWAEAFLEQRLVATCAKQQRPYFNKERETRRAQECPQLPGKS
jgi:hypothetical protein